MSGWRARLAKDPIPRLLREGSDVHLTPKAFDLLAALIEAAPRVLPKRELHERLWPGGVVSDATLVGMVKELRRALGDQDSPAPLIRTVHRDYAMAGADIIETNTFGANRVALAKHNLRIDYTELLSGGGKGDCPLVKQMLDGEGFPTLILLDQNGKVLYRMAGSNPAALNRLDWVIYNKLFPNRTTASANRPRR